MSAGYDYVPLTVGLRQMIRGEVKGIMGVKEVKSEIFKPASARYNPFSGEISVRMWAEDFNYSALDEVSSYLPEGAKVVEHAASLFLRFW